MIKKLKQYCAMDINDLNDEEIIGIFYEKQLQKKNKKELRIEKSNQEKSNILYVKWKSYDKSFKNRIKA